MVAAIDNHEVVENAAGLVGEKRIALAAGCEAEDIDGDERFESPGGIGIVAGLCLHDNLAHVRHVEETGGGAGVDVFLEDAGGILHRHVIAGKRHHAGAELQMERMKRGLFQVCLGAQERVSGQGRNHAGSFDRALSRRFLLEPPLSLCLRLLSLRHAVSRHSPECSSDPLVLWPESFRGGCSFGTSRVHDWILPTGCLNYFDSMSFDKREMTL